MSLIAEKIDEILSMLDDMYDEDELNYNAYITIYNAVSGLSDDNDKWVKVGGYATPGGDPVWRCPKCGKGTHVYGIEHGTYGSDISNGQWVSCPNCGTIMNGEKW